MPPNQISRGSLRDEQGHKTGTGAGREFGIAGDWFTRRGYDTGRSYQWLYIFVGGKKVTVYASETNFVPMARK